MTDEQKAQLAKAKSTPGIKFTPSVESEGAPISPGIVPIEQEPKDSGWMSKYNLLIMVASPVAMAVSYKKNRSVGWAIVHGFISLPYLIYRAIDRE